MKLEPAQQDAKIEYKQSDSQASLEGFFIDKGFIPLKMIVDAKVGSPGWKQPHAGQVFRKLDNMDLLTFWQKEGDQYVKMEPSYGREAYRSDNVQFLLRKCHDSIRDALETGLLPKIINPRMDDQKQKMSGDHDPMRLFDAFKHVAGSAGSGMISSTINPELLRKKHTERECYVYLLKASAPVICMQYSSEEYDHPIPEGVEAQDIIAFRKFTLDDAKPGLFFSVESPLYVRGSFIRNYPRFLNYVMQFFLESNEWCPNARQLTTPVGEDDQLPAVKTAVMGVLGSKWGPSIFKHKDRFVDVQASIAAAKTRWDIIDVLENQIEQFAGPSHTPYAPGLLSPRWSQQSQLKNKQADGYVNTIKRALQKVEELTLGPAQYAPKSMAQGE